MAEKIDFVGTILQVHTGMTQGYLSTSDGPKEVDLLEIKTSTGHILHVELFEREPGRIVIRTLTKDLRLLPRAANSVSLEVE